MGVKVKTGYWGRFNVPPRCVACGNVAVSGKKKVSLSKTKTHGWSGKRQTTTTLTLEFPLCQECVEIDKKVRQRGGILVLLALLVSAGICSIIAFVVQKGDSAGVGLGVIVGFGAFLLLGSLAFLLRRVGLTPAQRQRSRSVDRAVRIRRFKQPGLFDKTGSIVFEFQDASYANEFAQLNLGQIT